MATKTMTRYATVEAARQHAAEEPRVKSIARIRTRDGAECYICLAASYDYVRLALRRQPHPEIAAMLEEYDVLTPEARADQDRRDAEAAEAEKHTRRIYLSGRGWGYYSPVEWSGDLRRPDAEIVAECRAALDQANDVDTPLTDEQIATKVSEAKATLAAEREAQQAETDRIASLQAEARRLHRLLV